MGTGTTGAGRYVEYEFGDAVKCPVPSHGDSEYGIIIFGATIQLPSVLVSIHRRRCMLSKL